jgi:hypothetical protein
MVDTDKKEMMENGSNVRRPMQENFEEDFGHEIKCYFNTKLNGKDLVVIVDNQHNFSYIKEQIPIPKADYPSKTLLMPLKRSLRSNVEGSDLARLVILLKNKFRRSKALRTAI